MAEQQAAVMAAGLLEKKEAEEKASIGPSMPDPEPSQSEVESKPSAALLSLTNYPLIS